MDAIYTKIQSHSSLLLEGKAVFPIYPIVSLIVACQASSILLVFYSLAMFYTNGDSNLFRQVVADAQHSEIAKALITICVNHQ